MKRCSWCKGEKPTSEFARCQAAKDGLAYWCFECRRAARVRYGEYRPLLPVDPIRQAFEELGRSPYEVAARMGWFYNNTPDSHRVERVLGLKKYNPGKGYPPKYRERITPPMASALLEAMDLIPAEVGL
jgi:hypothetical protein